jgi:hypothetical protein
LAAPARPRCYHLNWAEILFFGFYQKELMPNHPRKRQLGTSFRGKPLKFVHYRFEGTRKPPQHALTGSANSPIIRPPQQGDFEMLARRLLVWSATLFVVAGCDGGAGEWGGTQKRLVGMSYKDLLECAGTPDAETTLDEHTGRVRYRGESTQVVHWSISGGVDEPFQAACDVTAVITDGRIVSATGHVDQHGFYDGCSNRFIHCFL